MEYHYYCNRWFIHMWIHSTMQTRTGHKDTPYIWVHAAFIHLTVFPCYVMSEVGHLTVFLCHLAQNCNLIAICCCYVAVKHLFPVYNDYIPGNRLKHPLECTISKVVFKIVLCVIPRDTHKSFGVCSSHPTTSHTFYSGVTLYNIHSPSLTIQ